MNEITFSYFEKIEKKVETILKVKLFKKTKKTAYQLWIDWVQIGFKKSANQIENLFTLNSIIYKQILAVVKFHYKPITHFKSKYLVLGITENDKKNLISTNKPTINGLKLH